MVTLVKNAHSHFCKWISRQMKRGLRLFFIEYIILASIVLGMNIIPAFMPPTWAVLAFFVIRHHLLLIPAVLLGATFATLGRVILAGISQRFFRQFFPRSSQENYESIGKYLNTHQTLTIPLVITYAFLPIPSNHVFIAAGLAKVNIRLLASSFFTGRLISYTFWISLTRKLSDNLEDIFSNHYSKAGSVVVEIAGLILLYLIGRIAWKKILRKIDKTTSSPNR